jgi:hypothetical protein
LAQPQLPTGVKQQMLQMHAQLCASQPTTANVHFFLRCDYIRLAFRTWPKFKPEQAYQAFSLQAYFTAD